MKKMKMPKEESYITFVKDKVYASKLTCSEIVKKTKRGIGETTLRDLLSGRVKPSVKTMVVLAKTLNFSLNEAFGVQEEV